MLFYVCESTAFKVASSARSCVRAIYELHGGHVLGPGLVLKPARKIR